MVLSTLWKVWSCILRHSQMLGHKIEVHVCVQAADVVSLAMGRQLSAEGIGLPEALGGVVKLGVQGMLAVASRL